MDLSKIKVLGMMQANMSYLNERQDVLAQNIANANVPGYEGKDLKPLDFKQVLKNTSASSGSGLATTQAGHISGTVNANTTYGEPRKFKSGEVTPTGNSIVLEDEVLKMSKNNLEYQQTTNLYRKMIEMLKTAIGNT